MRRRKDEEQDKMGEIDITQVAQRERRKREEGNRKWTITHAKTCPIFIHSPAC